jgi:MoaA/NifB/PqqE/SkfB family radical SAM enzyme
MKEFTQKLKIFLMEFIRAPRATSALVGRLVMQRFASGQVARLRETARQSPFILQIEGTNVCNAVCVFCANTHMQRPKGVMSLPLFEKIVKDYAGMGGGPVSLTPIIGEALLDPHLLERLRILRSNAAINQISLTTNALALDKYTDEEVCSLLETLYTIQVSIGGLDAVTYERMYGIDRFTHVERAMERLLSLNATVAQPAHITFAFRTNDWQFESRFRNTLDGYRQRGAFISHIWTYANYAGLVKDDENLNLVVMKSGQNKRNACIYASVAMSICWDGTITACGCADFEGTRLTIGNAVTESLADVWAGKKRTGLLDSFAEGKIPPMCRECSAYQGDTTFASAFFKNVMPHQPLPLDFYHYIWGG